MHTTSAGCTRRPDEQDVHDVAVLDRVPQQVALAGRSRGRTVWSNHWRVLWRVPLLPQLLPPPPPFFLVCHVRHFLLLSILLFFFVCLSLFLLCFFFVLAYVAFQRPVTASFSLLFFFLFSLYVACLLRAFLPLLSALF